MYLPGPSLSLLITEFGFGYAAPRMVGLLFGCFLRRHALIDLLRFGETEESGQSCQ